MPDLVFITGASSGLGQALARAVPFPANVVDISRSGPSDDSIGHVTADLSDPSNWPDVGAAMARMIGESDPGRAVLIHAAGTLTPLGFVGEVDGDAYADNVVLNSASGQVLGHYFLEAVLGRAGDHTVVMISSGAAGSVYPGWSSYGAGKAALDHWVRHVGAEQKVRGGARALAIAPGVIATSMQRQIRDTPEKEFPKVDRFHQLREEGRLASPNEAAAKVWRAIESDVETGSVIDVRDF
jgi:benzil reductase ((S)-benzoin forming)